MTGMIGMKQKVALLIFAVATLLAWFLIATEDGQAMGRSFAYFLHTLFQF